MSGSRKPGDASPPKMFQTSPLAGGGSGSLSRGSPQTGGTGGPTRRGGGRGAGKSPYPYSPYAKPPTGRQRPPSANAASGTPVRPPPPSSMPPSTSPAAKDAATPAPPATRPPTAGSPTTPSTLGRLLTPIRAAGGYFLGRVWGSSSSSSPPDSKNDGTAAEEIEDGPITLTDGAGTPIAELRDAPSPEIGAPETMATDTPPAAKTQGGWRTPRENSMHPPQAAPETPQVSLLAALKHGNNRPGQAPAPKPPAAASGPSAPAPSVQQTPPAVPSASVAKDIGAYATPYRSVLALLQEGPAGKKASGPSAAVASQSTSRQIPFSPVAVSPSLPALQQSIGQTPSLTGSRPLGIRAPPGLFSMGMSPVTGTKTRHRTASRSALAKRTPVSATPLHMTSNTGREGLAPRPSAPKPSSPGAAWTPMRTSTMALVEQYERKDTVSQKRTRSSASSPAASEVGTPLVGSGISSLKSYAFQQPVYRRRVRAKQDTSTAAAISQLGNTPRPPARRPLSSASADDGPARSKLTTETARRILMTLDTLVAKTPPKALPSPKSPLALAAPPAAEKKAPPPEPTASKPPAVSSAAAREKPSSSIAGGWGDDFLKSNAASFASATTAAEKEIQEKTAGSSAPAAGEWDKAFLKSSDAVFGAASKAAEKEIDEKKKGLNPAPGGSTFTFGTTSKASQPSFTFGAASTSPTKPTEPAQGFSFSPPSSAATPAKEGLKPPITFGAPVSAGSLSKPVFSSPSASAPSAAISAAPDPVRRVTFSFGSQSEAKEAATPSPSTTSSPSKPFGGQTPVFSFGGPRTSGEDLAVKAATAGRHPSGPEPVFEFGNGTIAKPGSIPKTPPLPKAMTFSEKDQAAAEATVKAAASLPLPGSDEEDDSPAKGAFTTLAPATASGGWGSSFLHSNASASAAAADAAKKDIEKKAAGAKPSATAAGLFSGREGLGSTSAPSSSPSTCSTPAAASAPVAATGWGDSFLKQNAVAHAAAVSAVQKEIEKSKDSPASAPTGLFSFGAPKPSEDASAKAPPPAATETPPSTSGTAAASGGWGATFLSANQSQASSATEAAKEAIKEADGGAASKGTGGMFSFGAPSSAPAPAATTTGAASSPAPSSSAPATGLFSFGGASTSAPAAASTAPVTFAFGGASASSTATSSAASMTTFSFGGGASASTPSTSPAPVFSIGGSSNAAPAPASANQAAAASPAPTFMFGGAAPTSATATLAAMGSAMSMGSGDVTAPPAAAAAAAAFGGTTAPVASAPSFVASSAPSFGSTSPSPFGGSAAPSFGSATPSLFGGSSAPSFGAASGAAAFGAASAPSFGGGSFGSNGAGAASASSFAFGGSAHAASSTASFIFGGGAAPAQTFGAPQAAPAPAQGFGAVPGQQQQPQAPFGGAQPSPTFAFGAGAPPAGGNPFGGQQQPQPAAPGGFGAAPAAAPGGFSFGAGMGQQQQQQAPPAFGGAPAPAGDMGGFSMGQAQQPSGPAGRRMLKARRKRGGK